MTQEFFSKDEVRGKAKDLEQTTEMYKVRVKEMFPKGVTKTNCLPICYIYSLLKKIFQAQITNEIRTIEESQRKLNGDLLLQVYLLAQLRLPFSVLLNLYIYLSMTVCLYSFPFQLYLFPQKSLARKAALVTAVVLSNHLVSQIIFLSQPWKDGGGNAAVACGLAVCILSGVLFYFDTGR